MKLAMGGVRLLICALVAAAVLGQGASQTLAQVEENKREPLASVGESISVGILVNAQIDENSIPEETNAKLNSSDRVAALKKLSGDRATVVNLSDRLERSRGALLSDISIWENNRKSLNEALDNTNLSLEEFEPGQSFLDQLTDDSKEFINAANLILSLKNAVGSLPDAPLSSNGIDAKEREIITVLVRSRFTVFPYSGNDAVGRGRDIESSTLNDLDSIVSRSSERINQEIERVGARIESEDKRIEALKADIAIAEDNIEQLSARINLTETLRAELAASLRSLDARASSLLDTELERSRYTSNATYVFGGLVGFVILGFFFIAYKTPDLRSVMFGAERGIQFIALFSIIIAIILFGILGILQANELSALLGGLSGYILGRGADGVSKVSGSSTDAKPAATPPTTT